MGEPHRASPESLDWADAVFSSQSTGTDPLDSQILQSQNNVVRSLQWTDECSVFVPEMDEEHQALFQISQQLRRAIWNGESQARIESLAGRLATRIASHFQHEERLMRLSRYSAIDWHERQHQTARGLLAALTDSMRGRGGESVFNALEALNGWMLDHIAVADRMLGAHLRNYQRERTASCEIESSPSCHISEPH